MAESGCCWVMTTFKDYLDKQAARPALSPQRTHEDRQSCERCDGEVFLLSKRGEATCAGCGAALKIPQ
jgi:hypothetical protein